MIPDGEILQAAISVQANAASTNPSYGHCDLHGPVGCETTLRTLLEEFGS